MSRWTMPSSCALWTTSHRRANSGANTLAGIAPRRAIRLIERLAADVLHRDPQDAVGLGAERIDVRRVRVVEPRRELGLAQEALDPVRDARDLAAQHLDDHGAIERRLLGEEHLARAALAEPLDDRELAERAADQARRRRVGGRCSGRARVWLAGQRIRRLVRRARHRPIVTRLPPTTGCNSLRATRTSCIGAADSPAPATR